MKTFFLKHLDDMLIVGGCALTVAAASLVNVGAGLGLAGIEMIILGVVLGIGGKKA